MQLAAVRTFIAMDLANIEAEMAAIREGNLQVESLTQAILAQAFRGELVPTDAEIARREGREYEPASLLLDRIQAERNSHEGATKAKRKKAAKK